MKKIDLGQTVGILANLGVIGGIVFLGFELHQSQLIGRAQTQTAIADARREMTQVDLSGPMAETFVRRQRGESLTPVEIARLRIWIAMWLRHFENVYYQGTQGLYDDEQFQANLREVESWTHSEPLVEDYFCSTRSDYSESFATFMDAILENSCDQ